MSQIVILLLVLTGPAIMAYCFVGIIWYVRHRSWFQAFSLDPSQGLMAQGLLWLSLVMPFFYFLAFGGIAWSGYSLSMNNQGFQEFIKISVLPLSCLALSLPISVLISRFHATGQTAEQIVKLTKKNEIDIFHAHRKELFSYFDQIGELTVDGYSPGIPKVHPRLHMDFFIRTRNGEAPTMNDALFEAVEKDLDEAARNIFEMLSTYGSLDAYLTASSLMLNVAVTLGGQQLRIKFMEKNEAVPMIQGDKVVGYYYALGRTTDDIIQLYRWLRAHFTNLCNFAGRELKDNDRSAYHAVDYGDYYKQIRNPGVLETLFDNQILQLRHRAVLIQSSPLPI